MAGCFLELRHSGKLRSVQRLLWSKEIGIFLSFTHRELYILYIQH